MGEERHGLAKRAREILPRHDFVRSAVRQRLAFEQQGFVAMQRRVLHVMRRQQHRDAVICQDIPGFR